MFQNCKILLLKCLKHGKFPNSALVDHLNDAQFNTYCYQLIRKYENFTAQTAESSNAPLEESGPSKGENRNIDADNDTSILKDSNSLNDSSSRTDESNSLPVIQPLPQLSTEGSAEALHSSSKEIENISSSVANDIIDDADDDGIEIISSVVRKGSVVGVTIYPDGRVDLPCILSTGDETRVKFCESSRNICSFKLKTRLYLPLTQQFNGILTCFPVLFDDQSVDESVKFILTKIFFVNVLRFLKAWICAVPGEDAKGLAATCFIFIAGITADDVEALPDSYQDSNKDQTRTFRKLRMTVDKYIKRSSFRLSSQKQHIVNMKPDKRHAMKEAARTLIRNYKSASYYDPCTANCPRVVANKAKRLEPNTHREVSLYQLITSVDILLAFIRNKEVREKIVRAHDARIVQFLSSRGIEVVRSGDSALDIDGKLLLFPKNKDTCLEPLAMYISLGINTTEQNKTRNGGKFDSHYHR